MGVSESTVGRELRRNGGKCGGYNWIEAQKRADGRKKRRPGNRRKPPEVMWRVRELLLEDWSPGQISGTLALEGIRISHETIYRMVRADATGELASHCRHGMRYRRKQGRRPRETRATNIPDRVSIHQRPEEADGRRFGDWEMDLIIGARPSQAMLTLTERSTNMIFIQRLPKGKKAVDVAWAVWRTLLPYRDTLLSITTDNGSEFAQHSLITRKLGVQVYFADSYASWQKGAVENANKLIRQYIPKGTDFNTVTDKYIRMVQKKINERPRKKLNFNTPKHEFYKHFY